MASASSDFQVIRELGRGSFGVVRLVRRKRDQTSCVIKEVCLTSLATEKNRNQAFSEAAIMKRLDCPFIVQYLDAFMEGTSLFLVLQYCSGGDLRAYLRSAWTLREVTIWRIALRIALGLGYLHQRRVLHRDLKCENVFLEERRGDAVRIGDLGLAKVVAGPGAAASTLCGTPRYFSPEELSGERYDARSDVWALGIILYELCSDGHRGPWHKAAGLPALMKGILEEEPPELPNRVEASLRELCKTLLIKDRSKRPQIEDLLVLPAVSANGQKYGVLEGFRSEAVEEPRPRARPRPEAHSSPGASPTVGSPAAGERVPSVPTLRPAFCDRLCWGRREPAALGPRFHELADCELCGATFGAMRPRHHCRNCGRSACGRHSAKRHSLPQFGYLKPQRVCDICAAFPLGQEVRGSRLLCVAADRRAYVWNSRSLGSPALAVGERLGFVGLVAMPASPGPAGVDACGRGDTCGSRAAPPPPSPPSLLLCTLATPSTALELRDLVEGAAATRGVPLSGPGSATPPDAARWFGGRAGGGPLGLGVAPLSVASSGRSWLAVSEHAHGAPTALRVLRVPCGSCLGHCSFNQEVTTMAVHEGPNGFVLCGTKAGSIMVWNVPGGECRCDLLGTLDGHGGEVSCLSLGCAGRLAASSSKDGTVRLWRAGRAGFKPEACEVFREHHASGDAAVSCSGPYVALVRLPLATQTSGAPARNPGEEHFASVWNLSSRSWERHFAVEGCSVWRVALLGELLATAASATAGSASPRRVHLWHVPTGAILLDFVNPSPISRLLLAEAPVSTTGIADRSA